MKAFSTAAPSAKQKKKQSLKARRRLRLGLGLMMALLLIISGKLILVQGLDIGGYAEAANAQLTQTQTLAASRGEIVDANGKVLAQSIVRYDIVVDQLNNVGASDFKRLSADGKTLETVTRDTGIDELANALGIDSMQVRKLVTGTSHYNVVAKSVTPELEAKIAELRIPGIASQAVSKRVYPMGQVAGNVVGFMGANGGGSGIEQTLNDQLTGTDGSRTYQMGKDGIVIPSAPTTIKPAVNGQTVKLTINSTCSITLSRPSPTRSKRKAPTGEILWWSR